MEKSYRIIRLVAENVKALTAVDITPKGNVVKITGKNGSGKTSVLDAIWWALGGKGAVQEMPIRRGQKKASIELDLGDMVVKRVITESGGTLVVESKDGRTFKSPQAVLDKMIGAISFDPLAFIRMDRRKQFDELRRVAKLEIDLDALAMKRKTLYDQRTEVNRQIKQLEGQYEGFDLPEKCPEHIDVSELSAELGRIKDLESKRSGLQRTVQALRDEAKKADLTIHEAQRRIAEYKRIIARHYEEIKQAQNEAAKAMESADEIEKQIAETTAPETAPVLEKISSAEHVNRITAEWEKRAAVLKNILNSQVRSKTLSTEIETIDKEKETALDASALPIPGLSFGDGLVLYNGLPIEQLSGAEQLKVSMALAMAANPSLRVIRITDGSLLDDDSMVEIERMAKENEFQIWLEVVDATGKVGVFIRDGAVVADNQEKVA